MAVTADSVIVDYFGGVRDALGALPVNQKTTFLSSSTSKVLTASAILKLVDSGQVALGDSLDQYFPDHPYGSDVTIQSLLNQSSGIPNPLPLRWLHTDSEHATYDEAAALKRILLKHPKRNFEPGQKYAYSNLSYWLLGKVIERISLQPYCRFMRDHVFLPLGISSDELSCAIPSIDNFARGHMCRVSMMRVLLGLMTESKIWDEPVGKWSRFSVLYMNGPAYGGLFASASGYASFLQDMLKPKSLLFSERVRDLFFSAQNDRSAQPLPTTLGWHRGTLKEHLFYSKPGGGPGYSSNVRIYRKSGVATVFLSNKTEISEGPIQAFSDALDSEVLSGD